MLQFQRLRSIFSGQNEAASLFECNTDDIDDHYVVISYQNDGLIGTLRQKMFGVPHTSRLHERAALPSCGPRLLSSVKYYNNLERV